MGVGSGNGTTGQVGYHVHVGYKSLYLFFCLQADWLTIGTPGIAEVVERNWGSEGVVFLLFPPSLNGKPFFFFLHLFKFPGHMELSSFF